jgi:hypothetical protein
MDNPLLICANCGAQIPGGATCRELYNELSLYTLAHPDPAFIHQYIVDAYAASHARENTKPITTAFALIGLYLFVERGYTGKQAQNAHKYLADKAIGHAWPTFLIPNTKTTITVSDVLATPAGHERDFMIKKWAETVWGLWRDQHKKVAFLVESFGC